METSSTNLVSSADSATAYYSSDGITIFLTGGNCYVDLTKEMYGTAINIDATASAGENTLYGDEAANLITSGNYSSTLWGGLDYANDILVGGWGYDKFWYGKSEGSDSILNASAIDTVALYDAATGDIVRSTYGGDTSGGTLTLYFDTGNSLAVTYSGTLSPIFDFVGGGHFAFNSATWSWQTASDIAQNTPGNELQVDWNTAPRFDNFFALVDYLDDCKYNLQTTVPVVCVGFYPNDGQIPVSSLMNDFDFDEYYSDGQSSYLLCEITNYPGERVAWAYTHGNTAFLTAEELQLYNLGVQIVNEAKSFSADPLYQELYIHDQIANRVVYYTDEYNGQQMRYQSAMGALIDGQANCQGYTDAFYMLGTMCGFDVDKVVGGSTGGGHAWNAITFGDASYFVDVTWDDGNDINYIYFNAPIAVIGVDHSWSPYYVPQNMQIFPDSNNFYHAPEYGSSGGRFFGTSAASAEDALANIAYRITNQGYSDSWIEAPFDYYYSYWDTSANYLNTALSNMGYNRSGSVYLNVDVRGNYMYYTARVR